MMDSGEIITEEIEVKRRKWGFPNRRENNERLEKVLTFLDPRIGGTEREEEEQEEDKFIMPPPPPPPVVIPIPPQRNTNHNNNTTRNVRNNNNSNNSVPVIVKPSLVVKKEGTGTGDKEEEESEEGWNNGDNSTRLRQRQRERHRYYSALYGKPSTRRRRTWEEDGFIIFGGNMVTLKNLDGEVITCSSKFEMDEETINGGKVFKIGNKEVQIQEEIDNPFGNNA